MDKLHIRLKQCREGKGLNQYEVSNILGIKQPTWNKYENGKSGMSAETLYHICKTLNVSADWLLGLDNDQ